MKTLSAFLAAILVTFGTSVFAEGAEGNEFVSANCGGCHALSESGYLDNGLTGRTKLKGPPLYYAGNKFNADWLVQWLQKPTRIRPAGVFPPAHIVVGDEGDQLNVDSLSEHMALDEAQAAAVAEYLLSLQPYSERLAAVDYTPGDIAFRMGQMNFSKFNNCVACHRDEPDYGGVSGPELYTGAARLQPAFIASYIQDPVAWDPYTLMPGGSLNAAAVAKLANYIKVLGEPE